MIKCSLILQILFTEINFMNHSYIKGVFIAFFILAGNIFAAARFQQTEADTTATPSDWFLRDPDADRLQGVSADKTYSTLLQGKPSKTVLVAVIDSGIDIDHEDLKDLIWTNEDEIPGNGKDDDKNGYVDDIHGWNFIGGKNGNVAEDTYELTREYKRLKPKFESADENRVSKKDKAEFEKWKKIKSKFEAASTKAQQQYDLY